MSEPFDILLEGHGFTVEDAIVRAGVRGIAIAAGPAGRSLVAVVGPRVDPASLRTRPGLDLPLRSATPIDTDGGERTLLVEDLPTGAPMVRLAQAPPGREGEAPGEVPAFLRTLAAVFASTHAAGETVGHLVPDLVFVDPPSLRLEGCGQRVLRADAGAQPIDGAGRLFGAAHLTPGAIQGGPVTGEDDVFLLAGLAWRWRHETDPFDGPLPERLERTLAGGPVAGLVGGDRADAIDDVLLRAFAADLRRRPSLPELAAALGASGVS